ncbi:MAG: hypothetical protein ABSE73_10930 [Planctomycetota bacterium]
MGGFRCVGLVVWFCGFALGAAEFQIGPEMSLDSLAIAAGGSSYLAVWRGLAPAPQMLGALVSTTGVVSTAFPVSDAASAPLPNLVQRSAAAFDGTNFFAVWADNRAGGAGIRGALVTPQGSVVGGADFLIAPISRTNNLAPQCVFTGAGFLAAWQDAAQNSAPGTQIFYALVSSQGVVSARGALPLGPNQNCSLECLAAGTAYEALLVFQDLGASPNETRGVRVNTAANTLLDPPGGLLLFTQDFSPIGFGAPVGAAYVGLPALPAGGGEYWILSSYSAQIDSSVFVTRLLPDGTVIRPFQPFAEVGQGTTGLAEDAFPRTFYNGNGEFLFLRNSKVSDTSFHILSKRVAAGLADNAHDPNIPVPAVTPPTAGLLIGPDRDPNMLVIDTASQGILDGAVAAAIGTQYFVAWMDGRQGALQPAAQLNVYGLLLDGTAAGDTSRPALKAVARASPLFGSSPLKVYFGTSGSAGIADSVHWDFGDGASDILGITSHTYASPGYYLAVLSLLHAGLAVRDFVRIGVDEAGTGGTGGPPQGIGGTLGPVSNGVNTNVVCTGLTVSLDFTKTGADSLRLAGYLDSAVMPALATGQNGTLAIAGKTYSFTTLVGGTYATSNGNVPVVKVGINQTNGYFVLATSSDGLRASFAALGANNETVAKPGTQLTIPLKLDYAGLDLNSYITATYTATAGKSGQVNYTFGSSGYPGSGYFRVLGAGATESGKVGAIVHTFGVVGNWARGGNVPLAKADSGAWRITLGNYEEDIPVTSLVANKGVYTYAGVQGKRGITGFYYNTGTGAFSIVWRNVPAEGPRPSGMVLASTLFWRADMALSVSLDLEDGSEFQGSAYVRLVRAKLNAKRWTLR